MRMPLGSQNGKPGPASFIMKISISWPILRWSRFSASASRAKCSSISCLLRKATPLMRVSILFLLSPFQYAPETPVSLNALSAFVYRMCGPTHMSTYSPCL